MTLPRVRDVDPALGAPLSMYTKKRWRLLKSHQCVSRCHVAVICKPRREQDKYINFINFLGDYVSKFRSHAKGKIETMFYTTFEYITWAKLGQPVSSEHELRLEPPEGKPTSQCSVVQCLTPRPPQLAQEATETTHMWHDMCTWFTHL